MKKAYSKRLEMTFLIRETKFGKRIKTNDGVVYIENEIDLMNKSGFNITKPVHRIKRIFEGELVEIQNAD